MIRFWTVKREEELSRTERIMKASIAAFGEGKHGAREE